MGAGYTVDGTTLSLRLWPPPRDESLAIFFGAVNEAQVTDSVLALFCSGLLYILTQTIFKESIEAYETSAFQRLSKGYRNPRRIRDLSLRISFLTLAIVFLYPVILIYRYQHLPVVYLHVSIQLVLLTYSLIVLTTLVLYLLACDPLPPGPAKLMVWIRNLVPSRLAAQESPSPD